MTYAFIRHGQTDWNRDGLLQGSSDIPLNDVGRAQAHEAAALLVDGSWDVVVSSPLSRARESAEIIATDLGIELGASYPELVERDYGSLEGTSGADAVRRYPDREFPDAEPMNEVAARGKAGLARIARDHPDADVVIVCHGTIIRGTLTDLSGQRLSPINNGSISTFRLEGETWRVLTVNGSPLLAVAKPES